MTGIAFDDGTLMPLQLVGRDVVVGERILHGPDRMSGVVAALAHHTAMTRTQAIQDIDRISIPVLARVLRESGVRTSNGRGVGVAFRERLQQTNTVIGHNGAIGVTGIVGVTGMAGLALRLDGPGYAPAQVRTCRKRRIRKIPGEVATHLRHGAVAVLTNHATRKHGAAQTLGALSRMALVAGLAQHLLFEIVDCEGARGSLGTIRRRHRREQGSAFERR